MKTDVDRPSTWKRFKTGSQCESCFAGCCTMPVEVKIEDLIRLGLTNSDEVENLGIKRVTKKLIKEKKIIYFREATGLFMLMQRANRDCIFLDFRSRKCTVYSKRPDVCRRFPEEGPRPGFCPHDLKKL